MSKLEVSIPVGDNYFDFRVDEFAQVLEDAYLSLRRPPSSRAKISFAPSGVGYGSGKCFAGETEFITDRGIRTMADAVGEDVMVWTGHGKWGQGRDKSWSTKRGWQQARVEKFGVQPLLKLTLTRHGVLKEIYTTAEHRWIVETGKYNAARNRSVPHKKTTMELKPGYRLWHANQIRADVAMSHDGVRAGFVYGDGSKDGSHGGCRVRLFGAKDEALVPFFENYNLSEPRLDAIKDSIHMNDNGVSYRVAYNLPRTYKDAPNLHESRSFLWGWLAGYFAADGNIHPRGSASITSHKKESIQAVRDVCAILGINTGSVIHARREKLGRMYDEWSISLDISSLNEEFFLIAAHKQYYQDMCVNAHRAHPRWTVVSVEMTTRVETVYCVVQPETERFALADGILTMNCPRQWFYKFTGGIEQEDDIDVLQISNMENGKETHARIQSVFDKAGILIQEEQEIVSDDPPIRGFVDLVVDWDGPVVGEIKTMKQEAFTQRRVDRQPADYHVIQLLIYMKILKLNKGFLLYENKNCVPTSSRILTRRGWLHHYDLIVGEDEILTYNPQNKLMEWEVYRSKVVKPHSGTLLKIGNKHASFLSTHDHKWVVQNYRGEDEILHTSELNSAKWVPRIADLLDKPTVEISDKEAEIIGWIASDGSIDGPEEFRRYRISQAKDSGVARIEELLGDTQFTKSLECKAGTPIKNSSHKSNHDVFRFYISAKTELTERLRQLMPNKEVLPSLVARMSASARSAYIRGLMGGDGCAHEGLAGHGESFGQLDGAVKESYQIAQYLNGNVVNLNEGTTQCYPGVRKRIRVGHPVEVPYDGEVWCPETVNGFWIMEQNGKIVITGNSGEWLIFPIFMTENNKRIIDDAFEWMKSAYKAYNDNTLPERPFDKTSKECKYCPFKKYCWKDEDGVVSLPVLEIE